MDGRGGHDESLAVYCKVCAGPEPVEAFEHEAAEEKCTEGGRSEEHAGARGNMLERPAMGKRDGEEEPAKVLGSHEEALLSAAAGATGAGEM